MRTALFGALAAGVLAAAAPSAVAAPTVLSGCFYDTYSQSTVDDGTFHGVIGVHAVVRDENGVPATATVGCKIQVNGVDAPGTTFYYTGTGVVAGADPIALTLADTDLATLCQNVDGGVWECRGSTQLPFPPQEVYDLLFYGIGPEGPDPLVCPVLKTLLPPQGDVTVPDPLDLGVGLLWDCPPYQWTADGA